MIQLSITIVMMINVQEFDTRWNEILLSMTKIPSDDILEKSVPIGNTWV